MQQEISNKHITNNEAVQANFSPHLLTLDQQNNHNYVPFLIKSHRFASQSNKSSSPPIGTYNLPSCFQRKKSPFEDRISHFILQNQKKNDQMCMFKSSINRFQSISNLSPGPASYNLFKIDQNIKRINVKCQTQKNNLIDLSRTCPSIPNKSNKYGYSMINGEIKNIQKSDEQLNREKQQRKQYAQTLRGQIFNFRTSIHNYHDADEKKKLNQQILKYLDNKPNIDSNSKSEINIIRKPKFQHLYHSKGADIDNKLEQLGPGQYEICRSHKKQQQAKFQFFGSTEVRFRQKNNPIDKGYSLLEMIKEKNQLDKSKNIKKSLNKTKNINKIYPSHQLTKLSPGPGQYDPKHDISKKTLRTAFFPAEERFKQNITYQDEQIDQEQLYSIAKNRSKQSFNMNNLKKDRFKPMHQRYDPVKSEQIYGILSEKNETLIDKSRKSYKKHGKLLKINSKRAFDGNDNIEIKSWSRDQSRKKMGYIKYLKQQLAFISYSPLPQQASKKTIKKIEKKQINQ